MRANPYEPPAIGASGENAQSPRSGIPWRRIVAVPLCVYGTLPLLYGGTGLSFIPGILAGGVSFPRGTPASYYVLFTLFNLALTAHGGAAIVAGLHVWRARWRRAIASMLFAVFFASATVGYLWVMHAISSLQ